MAQQKTAPDTEGKTDLGGMFYPVGYIVAAFPNEETARAVQTALASGGMAAAACRLLSSTDYEKMARKELAQNTGFLATLGKTDEVVQRGLDAARKGASFLMIHAPHNEDAVRVMEAVKKGPFEFAYRYHSLAIEELK